MVNAGYSTRDYNGFGCEYTSDMGECASVATHTVTTVSESGTVTQPMCVVHVTEHVSTGFRVARVIAMFIAEIN